MTEPFTPSPTIVTIFGATGDLAQRKLIPALWRLYTKNIFTQQTRIVGLAKDPHDDASFRSYVQSVLRKIALPSDVNIEEFCALFYYIPGDFEEPATYRAIEERLVSLEESYFKQCTNKLYYLAVPPALYGTVFERLADSHLPEACEDEIGWTRILVEKPFGRDLETAQSLDLKLGKLFKEEQIFRIDHYLAKETVQNIITFRFANTIFRPIWNNEHIAQVDIKLHEDIGVGERGLFYEDVGALRDVGQNHLLQMVALVAMEDPVDLEADAIRAARSAALEALVPPVHRHIQDRTLRGQYEGYREEQSVQADSQTETYFRLVAGINNRRWKGVPFVLEAGKHMKQNKVEIVITFKETINCVCQAEDQAHRNQLTIQIQPNEGISLLFWAKQPGLTHALEPKVLSFAYDTAGGEIGLPEPYEKVLFDCVRGDQTLFASTQEVKAAWNFITPILKHWQNSPLLSYPVGSDGPSPTEV